MAEKGCSSGMPIKSPGAGALCIAKGLTLETLPLEEYQKICDSFDEGVYQAISLEKMCGRPQGSGQPGSKMSGSRPQGAGTGGKGMSLYGKNKVGVVGATGYAGSEICRMILGHPQAEL